jgi:hypothetical protein
MNFMKFMFLKVYRVTQKYFYARQYSSMWAPVVARQISKRYFLRVLYKKDACAKIFRYCMNIR